MFRRHNPLKQIESYARDFLRHTLSTMTLGDLFADNTRLASSLQKAIDNVFVQSGMVLDRVLVDKVTPPAKVVQAMNTVVAAARELESQKIKSDADKYTAVKEAEANSERMILLGKGQAEQRNALSQGLTETLERFRQSGVSTTQALWFALEAQRLDMMVQLNFGIRYQGSGGPRKPKGKLSNSSADPGVG